MEVLGPLYPRDLLPRLAASADAAIQASALAAGMSCHPGACWLPPATGRTGGAGGCCFGSVCPVAPVPGLEKEQTGDLWQPASRCGHAAAAALGLQDLCSAFPFEPQAGSTGLAAFNASLDALTAVSDQQRREVVRALRRYRCDGPGGGRRQCNQAWCSRSGNQPDACCRPASKRIPPGKIFWL